MRPIVLDAAKGFGWALLAFALVAGLYAAEVFRGWEGAGLGAGAAGGAAYAFHRKPRTAALAVLWFALAIAGVIAWAAWVMRDFRLQIL